MLVSLVTIYGNPHMTRRNFALLLGTGAALATGSIATHGGLMAAAPAPLKIDTDTWRDILPPERFRILFRGATEPSGSSPLNAEKRPGTYICAACRLPLFSSDHKFDSGTGWPSFTRPIDADHIDTKRDFKLIWPRTEYHCARCGGHQGHVFDDGPPPTGQRWCNNGLALEFVPQGEALPPLREAGE